MKIAVFILLSLMVSSCSSNTKHLTTSKQNKQTNSVQQSGKGDFKACINKGVIVDLFAKSRQAGLFVPATKEYLVFDKIEEGNSTVAKRILQVIDRSPSLKPEVISAAFSIHCYSPALRSAYEVPNMKHYTYCNKFIGFPKMLSGCIRKIAGI